MDNKNTKLNQTFSFAKIFKKYLPQQKNATADTALRTGDKQGNCRAANKNQWAGHWLCHSY